MRETSIINTTLTFATFLTLSIAVHVVVILGKSPLDTLREHEAAGARARDDGERVK